MKKDLLTLATVTASTSWGTTATCGRDSFRAKRVVR